MAEPIKRKTFSKILEDSKENSPQNEIEAFDVNESLDVLRDSMKNLGEMMKGMDSMGDKNWLAFGGLKDMMGSLSEMFANNGLLEPENSSVLLDNEQEFPKSDLFLEEIGQDNADSHAE